MAAYSEVEDVSKYSRIRHTGEEESSPDLFAFSVEEDFGVTFCKVLQSFFYEALCEKSRMLLHCRNVTCPEKVEKV